MKNKSVLFVTRSYPPAIGGMETLSYNLTTRYKSKKLIIALKKAGKANLLWFIPFSTISAVVQIKKYDVLHLSDGVLCGIGWLIKKMYPNKRVVTNVHGLDLTYKSNLYQAYIKRCLPSIDLYICNSETTKKIAIDRGFDDKKCVVIPVGVEDKFNNSIPKTEARKEIINKYNFELDDFILLTTGRLIKRKGVYWFIKNVFTKLPKNIRYVIAGAGAEEIRITNLIQQKKLEERIVLAGKVSDADLITLYKGSDVFVMPNITVPNDVEGFGIVAIEASMSGLPVIASNVQGISDAVIDRSNGYLLREKDGNGYISRIKTYNKNRSLLTEDGSVFSVFTKNKYNWESVVSIYKKYLNSV